MNVAPEHCAACGKGGESLKTCGGCNAVKYCNAECQKEHRKHHKANCKKKAAEFEVALFEIGKRAAELLDEILFKKPPPREDCSICMLQLPNFSMLNNRNIYQPCCGQVLCGGCVLGMGQRYDCPFCRSSRNVSDKVRNERCTKRMIAVMQKRIL